MAGEVTLTAYNADGASVDDTTLTLDPALQRVAVMGRGIARVVFNATAQYWVVDDICIIREGLGEGVLVLFDSCGGSDDFVTPALANLGFSNVTFVNGPGDFEFAIRTGVWDLVVLDEYNWPLSTAIMDALAHYYYYGGRIIFASWDLMGFSAHDLLAIMGVTYVSSYTTPEPVFAWVPTPLFDTPNSVPDLGSFANTCNTDGHRVEPTTATAVAGYTGSAQPNEAALTISSDNRVILNAFTPGLVNQDVDGDGKNDMIELYENEIFHLIGVGPSALAVTPPEVHFELLQDEEATQVVTVQNVSSVPLAWSAGALKVLLVAAENPGRFRTELEREPGIGIVDYVDARVDTPSAAFMSNYDAVIVASNWAFADAAAMGDNLADFVDAGGKVIHATFTFADDGGSGWQVQGRFATGGYMAFNGNAPNEFYAHVLGDYDAGHPIMANITTIEDSYVLGASLTFGSELVAGWDNGTPMVATKSDRIVGINIFVPGDVAVYGGDVSRLFRNAVVWLSEEKWLTTTPILGSLLPGESASVELAASSLGLPLGFFEQVQLKFAGMRGGRQLVPVSLGVYDPCLDEAILSQRVAMPYDAWNAYTSSNTSPHKVYDNVSGLPGNIVSLQWWGLDLAFSGGWTECDRPAPDQFLVGFYTDNGGIPGAAVAELTLEPAVTDTGVDYYGYRLKRYQADLPSPLALPDGWVSVQGIDSDTCWFLWSNSPFGDHVGMQDSGSGPANMGVDLSLCVVTDSGGEGEGEGEAPCTEYPWAQSAPEIGGTSMIAGVSVGASGLVTDVNVTVNITQYANNETTLSLESPAGTVVYLVNQNCTGANMVNTVFDDEAPVSINDGAAPYTGVFRPIEPLSAFAGEPAIGPWKLHVTDSAVSGEDYDLTLESWSLCVAADGGGEGEGEGEPACAPYPSVDVPVGIETSGTAVSSLEIFDAGTVQDVNMVFDITCDQASSLELRLTSPQGTEILLFSELDHGGENFEMTELDDEAALSIYDGYAPYNGSYYPQQALSTFDGESMTGVWELSVRDVGNTIGALNSWRLCIQAESGGEGEGEGEDGCTVYSAADTPVAVPISGGTASTQFVSEGVTVGDLNATVNLNCDDATQVSLFLESPEGMQVTLVGNAPAAGSHFTNTVFDDEAGTSIYDGAPPYTGVFRPDGLLSVLESTNAAGD